MPSQFSYLAEQNVLEARFHGQVSADELDAGVAAALCEGEARGTSRFLCDVSQLTGGHSIFDLYALAERLHEMGMPFGAREALIVRQQPLQTLDTEFWETLCRNRGFEVRTFLDRDSAMAWLTRADEARTGT